MKRKEKRKIQFGMLFLDTLFRNGALLLAGLLLMLFSAFLTKTLLYVGISLCIAFVLSCAFQLVFESTSKTMPYLGGQKSINAPDSAKSQADTSASLQDPPAKSDPEPPEAATPPLQAPLENEEK